jgi:hypothetical protein
LIQDHPQQLPLAVSIVLQLPLRFNILWPDITLKSIAAQDIGWELGIIRSLTSL